MSDLSLFAHSVNSPDIDFSKEQLWRALAHEVDVDGKLVVNPYKKWSDIDSSLPSKKIEILIAPPTSGTRDAFVEIAMSSGCNSMKWIKNLKKTDTKKFLENRHFLSAYTIKL